MNIEDQKLISFEFGRDAVDALSRHIDLFGNEFIDVPRVLATTRKIRQVDMSEGLECLYEALNYEPFYYDGFQDLKNCIKETYKSNDSHWRKHRSKQHPVRTHKLLIFKYILPLSYSGYAP